MMRMHRSHVVSRASFISTAAPMGVVELQAALIYPAMQIVYCTGKAAVDTNQTTAPLSMGWWFFIGVSLAPPPAQPFRAAENERRTSEERAKNGRA